MFQECVSISACIFYVFMNIYTVYVCINGHTAGEKKLPTYLPYFQWPITPIQFFFFGGGLMVTGRISKFSECSVFEEVLSLKPMDSFGIWRK